MKKIINVAVLTLITLGLSSCLKDKTLIGPDSDGAINNIIEFKNPAPIASSNSSTYPLYAMSFDVAPTGALNLEVNYAGANVAPEDITVNIALAPDAITTYNTQNGTTLVPLDANLYTLPTSMSVVIPKGQRTGSFNVTVKPSGFDFTKAYALGFKITSASSGAVSGNFGTIICSIGAKNAYDGIYSYTTSANTSLVPSANKTVTLITLSANSVSLSPGLLGTYSNAVTYTVDPTTKLVTVDCPSLGVQTPQDTRSKWDPATKTMTVYWKQGNGGRTFEETFKFKSAR